MLALRWVLGVTLALMGGSFAVLSAVAGGFRRSFGASPVHALVTLLPLLAAGLLLAALIAPGHRALVHVAAGAALVLAGFALWQMISEAATVMLFLLLYLALWMIFYWDAAWR